MKDYARYCNKKINSQKGSCQLGVVNFNLIVLISLILGTLIYLAQTNSIVSMGFDLRDYKQQVTEKQQVLERLQVEATKLQSIPVIEQSLEGKKMVQIDSVSYLSPSGGTFAVER